jgi:hypothetical protein
MDALEMAAVEDNGIGDGDGDGDGNGDGDGIGSSSVHDEDHPRIMPSSKLKSHCFCSPHNGAAVASESIQRLAVNKQCLKHFTILYIGSGSNFKALKSSNQIEAACVD